MTNETPRAINQCQPWMEPWAEGGLETIGKCPVCEGLDRQTIHSDLVDNTFLCAPGVWHLWQCTNCRSAYLDPRPTTETIGTAYQKYYTHQINKSKLDYDELPWLNKQRRKIVNGYTNRRFGTRASHANRLGAYLIPCFPRYRRRLDREYRHLPETRPQDGTLLDLGCGNGGFLSIAKRCGWKVVGIDPDPSAVVEAQSMGHDARQGSIELLDGQHEIFDLIFMSHVTEHLHDPIGVFHKCYRLLKPGGQIWIETPNIDARGRIEFDRNWRGLEAPRHLVLFNVKSLRKALRTIGFQTIKREIRPIASLGIFKESLAIKENRPLNFPVKTNMAFFIKKYIIVAAEVIKPTTHEMITLTARKQGDRDNQGK